MIKFKRLTDTAQLPKRATDGAAGFDLHYDGDSLELYPGERQILATGIAVEFAYGIAGIIKPRSGLAAKYGIDVLAGVIDTDYRGEVKVILINHGDRPVQIRTDDRIAQLVVISYAANSEETAELDDTNRGTSGFGSTGVN
jgi:dUTP pyrophosphatase